MYRATRHKRRGKLPPCPFAIGPAAISTIAARGWANALRSVTFATLVMVAATAFSDDSVSLQWQQTPGKSVALLNGEDVVWQFCYAEDQPKPYFHPVALPDGTTLTWNSPPDHAWHHALWFSWKFLNGVNYWEPAPGTGSAAGRTIWSHVGVSTRPDHTARIDMDLTYAPQQGPVVLAEHRRVESSSPDETGRYHFDWTSTFTAREQDVVFDRTPLPGEPGGKPWGGYAGLSVRLAAGLTQREAASTNGPVDFNDQSNSRLKADALDYNGVFDGQRAGIAICDHPHNLHHPTPWYVIRANPMSYFSPAVICYAPHTLKAGQSFTLRYRVIVHPGRWDAERLKSEYRRFSGDLQEKRQGGTP